MFPITGNSNEQSNNGFNPTVQQNFLQNTAINAQAYQEYLRMNPQFPIINQNQQMPTMYPGPQPGTPFLGFTPQEQTYSFTTNPNNLHLLKPSQHTNTRRNNNTVNINNEDADDFSDPEAIDNDGTVNHNKHSWQVVVHKRKRPNRQTSTEMETQGTSTGISNRYEALRGNDNIPNDNTSDAQNNKEKRDPKPPPIYIYGVTNYKDMITNLSKVTEENTYTTKALANNTVKVNANDVETYRKLIRHVCEEEIVHHTYQVQQDRAYRVVIRDLHPTVPESIIKEELQKKGHKVRNIMNIRHRVSKEPLPLFFVDIEPDTNNKEIYKLDYLLHCKIKVEAPRNKRIIAQCTRCQDYGHTKSYCKKPFKCVKCGGLHDTSTCTKARSTPATCALCQGNHPANYKGCKVYLDLIDRNHSVRSNRAAPIPQNNHTNQIQTQPANPNVSYAQVTSNQQNNPTNNNELNLASKLTEFLNEFKNMFNQLLNQNSMILTMLTTVINNLTK